MAGASLLRPAAGFGSHHQLHESEHGHNVGDHMPVRIEFIETAERVAELMPALCELLTDGLIEAHKTRWFIRPRLGLPLPRSAPSDVYQRAIVIGLFLLVLALCSPAQNTKTLSLEEAEKLATQNHPRIAAAGANAQAAGSIVAQVKSAFQPLVTANLTTAGVDRDTTIAAGTLQTSGLASRAATDWVSVSSSPTLVELPIWPTPPACEPRLKQRNVDTTRAQILLQVDQAYYATLAADAVLKVAQARVHMQDVTLRQVRALAESSLKSTLDVSFAEVLDLRRSLPSIRPTTRQRRAAPSLPQLSARQAVRIMNSRMSVCPARLPMTRKP